MNIGDRHTLRVTGSLRQLSYHEPHLGMIQRPAGSDGYVLLLTHQSLLVRLHGVAHECPAGSVILWSPGEAQYYGRPRTTWELSRLECLSAALSSQLAALHIPCNRLLVCPDHAILDDLWRCMHHEFCRAQPDQALLLRLFEACLLALSRQTTERAEPLPPITMLQGIRAYLDQHYTTPIHLEELAGQFNLSISYLSHTFKREFGISPIKYLTRLRMEAARQRLQESSDAIAAVAHQVGYANEFYFTRLFRAYFSETPSAFRQRIGSGSVAASRTSASSVRPREGWRIVSHLDFAAGVDLDPRWQAYTFSNEDQRPALLAAPGELRLQGGQLSMLPSMFWTNLRWEEDLTEESLVEVVFVNTHNREGVNLAVSLSGDLCDGYRLRIFMDTMQLETIANGYWEVLVHCALRLDPRAAYYHLVFWRVGDEFFAELNNERFLAFYDPFAPRGPRHRTVAVGRFGPGGDANISSLRILARPHTLTQDALEPGRVLLRKGYLIEARQWFLDAAGEQTDPRLRQEAEYYAALALQEHVPERESALRRISEDTQHAFRTQALHALALCYIAQQHYAAAVETARCLAMVKPSEDISQEIATKIIEALRGSPLMAQQHLLALLARLPITQLRLQSMPVTSLAPLAGMSLRECHVVGTRVTDLSPLRRMPLEIVTCNDNELADLSPLADLPLHTLECAANTIVDLSPLQGMRLQRLDCSYNLVADLTPIAGMPLSLLHCNGNRISDLTPLRGMPLASLSCNFNSITGLSPLHGMPLTSLRCSLNQIADLTPLCGMRLEVLECEHNPVVDLTPLAGMPLTTLHISGVPITEENRRIIASLPLRHLWCGPAPEVMALVAQVGTLLSYNGHNISHVTAVGPVLAQLLEQFHRGDAAPHPALVATLRSLASYAGDCTYISLPCPMQYHEADRFTRWLGGTLPCPATPVQFDHLCQYISSVTTHVEQLSSYFLGLHLDATGQHTWSNGTPYTWEYLPPKAMSVVPESCCASFRPNFSTTYLWGIGQTYRWFYVVIEWPG